MLTEKGPYVLEFNARFGDPETQAIMPRLKSDLVELMERAIDGKLEGFTLEWDPRPCVSVVIASGGYPKSFQEGRGDFRARRGREAEGRRHLPRGHEDGAPLDGRAQPLPDRGRQGPERDGARS